MFSSLYETRPIQRPCLVVVGVFLTENHQHSEMASGSSGDSAIEDELTTTKAKPSRPGRKPHTLDMVLEAITQNTERKGVTVDAIKKHLAVGTGAIMQLYSTSKLHRNSDFCLSTSTAMNMMVRRSPFWYWCPSCALICPSLFRALRSYLTE